MAPTMYKSPYGQVKTQGLQGKQLNRVQYLANNNRLGQAQKASQKFRVPKVQPPQGPTQPVVSSAPIAQAQPAPAAPGQDLTSTMFPNERMFEPQNYEGSPLYKFQVKAGEDALAKSLSARGLTGSGEAIRQELNIPMQAAAQDTDRITRLASENANRLQTYQTNEADRLERNSNNQWQRGLSLAELMAQQSPWQGALQGLNQTANLTKQQGQSLANYLSSQYSRGGGRGRGSAFVPAQLPTGPDFSNLRPAEISGQQSSNNGWGGILSGLLGSLF